MSEELELSPSGMTCLVLKNSGDDAAEAEYAHPSTAECSCGSRRAADLDAGTGGAAQCGLRRSDATDMPGYRRGLAT